MKKFKVTMTRVFETEIFVDAENLESIHNAIKDSSHKDYQDIWYAMSNAEMEAMNVTQQSFSAEETEIDFNDYTIK